MCGYNYRPLSGEEIFEVLRFAKHCRLGMADDNQPYVIPMDYHWRYENERLLFTLYTSKYGEKMICMKKNPKVSLEFEIADGDSMKSVIVRGLVINLKSSRDENECMFVDIAAVRVSGRESTKDRCDIFTQFEM